MSISIDRSNFNFLFVFTESNERKHETFRIYMQQQMVYRHIYYVIFK